MLLIVIPLICLIHLLISFLFRGFQLILIFKKSAPRDICVVNNLIKIRTLNFSIMKSAIPTVRKLLISGNGMLLVIAYRLVKDLCWRNKFFAIEIKTMNLKTIS